MGCLFSRNRKHFRTPLHKLEPEVVPEPLETGIAYIEKNAIEFQGLYRVCGNRAKIIKMAEMFDHGQHPDYTQYGPANTSGLVKYYLAELPEPVATYARYEDFLAAQQKCDENEQEGFERIKKLLSELPKNNFLVLEYMIRHLNTVSARKESNQMSDVNLAIVFSPALFRSLDPSPVKSLQDTPVLSKLMLTLMRNHEYFFS